MGLDEKESTLEVAPIQAVHYGSLVTVPMEYVPFDSETVLPIALPSRSLKVPCHKDETTTAVLDTVLEYQRDDVSTQGENTLPHGKSMSHDHNVFDKIPKPNAETSLSDRDLGIEN